MSDRISFIEEITGDILTNKLPSFHSQGCVPILGAGVSTAVFPNLTSATLTNSLVKKFQVPKWVQKDLTTVADYIAATKNPMWPKKHLTTEIAKITSQEKNEEGWEALKYFVSLPFQVIITTNYDHLIEEAAIQVGKKPITVVCNCFDVSQSAIAETFPDDLSSLLDEDKLVVYHLHGTMKVPSSLVLSRDDYVDFLVSFSKDKANEPNSSPMLPAFIHSAFAGLALLLLGYSMDDINFRVLIKAIRAAERATAKSIFPGLSILMPPSQFNLCRMIAENCDSQCLNMPKPLDRERITRCINAKVEEAIKEDDGIQKDTMKRYLESVFDWYVVNVLWESFEEFVEQLKKFFPPSQGGKP